MSVIQVVEVTHRYGRSTALSQVSFTVEAGEVLALAGPSGSGKSTVVHLVAGLDAVQDGTVTVLDRRPSTIRDWTVLSVVPQQHGLLTGLTVAENVRLPGLTHGRAPGAAEAMDVLGVAAMADRLVEDLSLGEQQRVAVARALAGAPRALVLDEPSAHQDEAHVDVVVSALRAAADTGSAVLVATHDPALLARADRTIHLADGRVVARVSDGTVTGTADRPGGA